MTKQELSNRIWKTRKARINASSRLSIYDQTLSILLPYYSVALITLQAFSAYFPKAIDPTLGWISISLSVVILALSLIVSGQDFKIRAERMKNCYLQLDELEARLTAGESKKKIALRYAQILSDFDNHHTFDFWKEYLFQTIPEKHESWADVTVRHTIYLSYKFVVRLIVTAAFFAPIVLFIKYIAPNL